MFRHHLRLIPWVIAGALLAAGAPTPVAAATAPSFPSAVSSAMTLASKATKAALWAPTWPDVAGSASQGYLTASEHAGSSSYGVTLYYTTKSLAVNSSQIASLTKKVLATYSGQMYSTAADATASVQTNLPRLQDGHGKTVSLKLGLRAQFGREGSRPVLRWTQNSWTIERVGIRGSMKAAATAVDSVLNILAQAPSFQGTLWIDRTKTGLSARAMWRVGTTAITLSSTDGLRNMMTLLRSMTTWSGQAAVPSLPPVVWFGPSANRSVYITIDDGWFPSNTVVKIMQEDHVPITAFIIQQAEEEHPSFWQSFVKAGGIIEDHTFSHPYLPNLQWKPLLFQWTSPRQLYLKIFHQPILYGRPPYGGVSKRVQLAAKKAGLKALIMWAVVDSPSGVISTWNQGPITPGEIILMHWDPGLGGQFIKLLALLKKDNLQPRYLPTNLGG